MPFRIGLDARMVGPVMTGLGRYALGLARHLPPLDPANHFVIIHRGHGWSRLAAEAAAHKRRLWRELWVALAETQAEFGLVSAGQVEDLQADVLSSQNNTCNFVCIK